MFGEWKENCCLLSLFCHQTFCDSTSGWQHMLLPISHHKMHLQTICLPSPIQLRGNCVYDSPHLTWTWMHKTSKLVLHSATCGIFLMTECTTVWCWKLFNYLSTQSLLIFPPWFISLTGMLVLSPIMLLISLISPETCPTRCFFCTTFPVSVCLLSNFL